MHKWMRHLPIILIGLISTFIFQGCNLFMFDPPTEWHRVEFENLSSHEIKLTFKANEGKNTIIHWEDSFYIGSMVSYSVFNLVGDEAEKATIEKASNEFKDVIITLYIGSDSVKSWKGSSDYFEDTINSPFNYNSWEIRSVPKNPQNIVGAVTFTISDEDLQ
ncbi:hypothetical protein [Shiella aurantiaca]|nr:hypothetical protein [Shiella aurantiaca]